MFKLKRNYLAILLQMISELEENMSIQSLSTQVKTPSKEDKISHLFNFNLFNHAEDTNNQSETSSTFMKVKVQPTFLIRTKERQKFFDQETCFHYSLN